HRRAAGRRGGRAAAGAPRHARGRRLHADGVVAHGSRLRGDRPGGGATPAAARRSGRPPIVDPLAARAFEKGFPVADETYRAVIPYESLDPLTIGSADDESKVYREQLELEIPVRNLLAAIYPDEP